MGEQETVAEYFYALPRCLLPQRRPLFSGCRLYALPLLLKNELWTRLLVRCLKFASILTEESRTANNPAGSNSRVFHYVSSYTISPPRHCPQWCRTTPYLVLHCYPQSPPKLSLCPDHQNTIASSKKIAAERGLGIEETETGIDTETTTTARNQVQGGMRAKGIGIETGETKTIVVKAKIGNENDAVIRAEGTTMTLIVIETEIGTGETASGNEVDLVNGLTRKSGNTATLAHLLPPQKRGAKKPKQPPKQLRKEKLSLSSLVPSRNCQCIRQRTIPSMMLI